MSAPDFTSWLPGLLPQGTSSTGKIYTLSPTSGALSAGDAVCVVPSDSTGITITKATLVAAAAAGGVLGLVEAAYSPGATDVEVADGGTVGNGFTALGAGAAVAVVLGSSGRAIRSSATSRGGEIYIGVCDTSGNITVSTSKIPSPTYNPRDYGCPCDGLSDDRPGLLAMLTAMPHTGGRVDLDGMLYCGGDLHINRPLHLRGKGGGNGSFLSGIEFAPGCGMILDSAGTASDGVGSDNHTIEHLDIVGRMLYRGAGFFSSGISKVFVANAFVRAGDCYIRGTGSTERFFRAGSEGHFGSVIPSWSDTPGSTITNNGIVWTTECFPQMYAMGTAYSVGQRVFQWGDNRYYFECSVAGTSTASPGKWAAATVYALNAIREPLTATGMKYKVTAISGTHTSHATTEPKWPTLVGETVIDNAGSNQITWTCLESIAPSDFLNPVIGGTNIDNGTLRWVTKLAPGIRVESGLGQINKVFVFRTTGAAVHVQAGSSTNVAGITNADNGRFHHIIAYGTGLGMYMGGDDVNGWTIDGLWGQLMGWALAMAQGVDPAVTVRGHNGGHLLHEHSLGGGSAKDLYIQTSTGRPVLKDGTGVSSFYACMQEVADRVADPVGLQDSIFTYAGSSVSIIIGGNLNPSPLVAYRNYSMLDARGFKHLRAIGGTAAIGVEVDVVPATGVSATAFRCDPDTEFETLTYSEALPGWPAGWWVDTHSENRDYGLMARPTSRSVWPSGATARTLGQWPMWFQKGIMIGEYNGDARVFDSLGAAPTDVNIHNTLGSFRYNWNPSIGAPSGWWCTAAGKPGTWVAGTEIPDPVISYEPRARSRWGASGAGGTPTVTTCVVDSVRSHLSTAGATPTVIETYAIPLNSAEVIEYLVVAKLQSALGSAAWKVTLGVSRGASGAAVIQYQPTPTLLWATDGLSTLVAGSVAGALSGTTGSVDISATGIAATSIHWECYRKSLEAT